VIGPLTSESAPGDGASGRRLALIVAVTDYLDTSLRRLRAPAGDAAELRDLLADPDVGGFTVTSVINERAHQVRVAIEDFLADRHHDDFLLLYLSCHGLVDARRRLYFAARDTLKHRLASSGVDSLWLLDQLEDCRARRQVVILDCCFSGAFARGAKGADDLGLGERLVGDGRGRVVLTASRGTEYSFEGEALHTGDGAVGSVFTSALIQGIRTGRADTDHDGEISVEDAYAYAFDQVRRAGTQQTPQRWLYGAEGSILLARTPPTPEQPPHHPPPSVPPVHSEAHDERPLATLEAVHAEIQPAASRPWRNVILLTTIGAGAAAVATLVTVLVTQNREDPGSTQDEGLSTTGEPFTQEAPWRLRIDDAISEVSGRDDNGCHVLLLSDDSGEVVREWEDFYGTKSFQMRRSGTFHYRVNDPGCQVLPQQGDGGASSLPFVWSASEGDTPVFESPGAVTVDIENWHGTPTCQLQLISDADGRALDIREPAEDQTSERLESNGPARVFIAATTCSIRVSTP
jgi:hypothetical protein